MNYQKFRELLADTAECRDLPEYIAECGGSLPAEYCKTDGNVETVADALTYIWDYAQCRKFNTVLSHSGKNMANISRNYDIPYRTLQNWAADLRNPPLCELDLLAFAVLTDIFPADS